MTTQTQPTAPAEAEKEKPATKARLEWKLAIGAGLVAGIAWTLILMYGNAINLLAGIAPVVAGIFVGRKIEGRALTHGLIISAAAVIGALAILLPIFLSLDPSELSASAGGIIAQTEGATESASVGQALATFGLTMMVSLVPFPIYGTWISLRAKERNGELKREVERRGGTLQRPGRVVAIEDVQALPLPKFASWVLQIFKDNGFALEDYKFGRELIDLRLKRVEPAEDWIVRCVIDDPIKPGQVQALLQDLKDTPIPLKGVLVTSMNIHEGALKAAKGRRNIEILDGATLLEIS